MVFSLKFSYHLCFQLSH